MALRLSLYSLVFQSADRRSQQSSTHHCESFSLDYLNSTSSFWQNSIKTFCFSILGGPLFIAIVSLKVNFISFVKLLKLLWAV